MRIVFWIVTAIWVGLAAFVAYWYQEIDISGIRFVAGATTFSLGICAIIEVIRVNQQRQE